MVSLSSSSVTTIQGTTPAFVDNAFGSLSGRFSQCDWLNQHNRYRVHTVTRMEDDFKQGKIRTPDLRRYIAASTILHCSDGWGYLGRAANAHCSGDPGSAQHLAYYAELRAALSILARQGIGVFRQTHFALDSRGNPLRIPGPGTHDMAWLALECWANSTGAANVLADAIRPEGIALKEWLDASDLLSAWQPVGQEWLSSWGLDLKQFVLDRDARNEVSYRPSLQDPQAVDASRTCRFLSELWSLYEPHPGMGFRQLDRHLLRLSLEKAFSGANRCSPRQARVRFRNVVARMLGTVNLSTTSSADRMRRFLLREAEEDDPNMVVLSRGRASPIRPESHLDVLARAALMLRVASGGCLNLLNNTHVDFEELRFWWEAMGQKRGFWDTAPDAVHDLWRDVAQASADLGGWTDNNPSAPRSLFREHCSSAISRLGDCELIGLWGLCT